MERDEIIKAVEAKGKKHIIIKSVDKDGHNYEVRIIAMPEMSSGEINGTAAVIIDGNHYKDMTLHQVAPIFEHMVSVDIY